MRGYDAWKTRSDLDDWAALNHEPPEEEVDEPQPEETMTEFQKYRRTQIAEMRPYQPGEAWNERISVSAADKEAGSPKEGDMIARNPTNPDDQWLVAQDYFVVNFEPLE